MPEAGAALLARVVRGGFTESVHMGHAAVVGPDGEVLFAAGDPEVEFLPRSSIKPLQALAGLQEGAPLAGETLAIACASHAGESFHVDAVDRILDKAGLTRSALGNVPDWPRDPRSRDELVRAGRGAEPVFMNCSGKHAGMLAACVARGWPVASYRDPQHPLQRRVLDVVAGYTGMPVRHVVVDGCGAPCPSTTLAGLARAVSRLVCADRGTPPRSVVDAMREYPSHIGGTGHVNTRFMQMVPGSVAKGGAEGVLVAALGDGVAVAVKCADGAPRSVTAVAVAALRAAGAGLDPLPDLELVPVHGGGEDVGRVVVTAGLPPAEGDLR